MAIAHRRQPKRSIVPRIFLIADANETGFQKLHNGGQNRFPAESAPLQVNSDVAADLWQRAGEGDHAGVFGFIPRSAPAPMITILLAAARIAARRLQMPV